MKIKSFLKRHKIWVLGILLIISIAVRLPGLFSRAIWYDESITLLETAGNARPSWPQEPTPASIAKNQFKGTPTLTQIAEDLRQTDVHPPVYYWLLALWRRWLGFSLETSRIFSLICSLGTILALYLLLKAGNIENPFIPTLVYAISTGAIFLGHEARAYALSSLLIGMGALFAYLASEATCRSQAHLIAYSTAMALCCGIAFQTNYLTLFPICIILLWFLINAWSALRVLVIAFPLITVSISLIGFPSFLAQLSARPNQATGFIGIFSEIKKILTLNAKVLWTPIFTSTSLNLALELAFIVVVVILLGASINQLLKNWSKTNRKLLMLFLGLALAPSLGLFMMNIISDKNLAAPRYVILAGPSLAAILTYGISRPISSQLSLTKLLLPILLGLQMIGINWGFERTVGWSGSNWRSLASTIKVSSSPSHVVVVGKGVGRGDAGTAVYELDSEAMVVVLDQNSNLRELQYSIQNYDDVWVVFSTDRATASIENELLRRLAESGRYTEVSRQESVIHLRTNS
ncbi:hypothetical protein N836_35370 [Leptolyngbya sp. Heron Island J]|uniref:glycosyltransferase family 39 protein n=1 Tax=Leptolyngbya sp. Heron Island J TaxID=1385935 RepID=UPI0003B947D7|nr:glycosyltransferase family 39 protein [Leptolyngbya sp. Heron Island J]ESA37655.1 hypothetical protein N836_35370 [Leptolyngbya sp. Heron Island J]